MSSELSAAHKALLNYEQADEEGIMVLASRQAIHEVSEEVNHLTAERDAAVEALRKIAEGRLDENAPDVMTCTPHQFQSGMLTWCQQTARNFLKDHTNGCPETGSEWWWKLWL